MTVIEDPAVPLPGANVPPLTVRLWVLPIPLRVPAAIVKVPVVVPLLRNVPLLVIEVVEAVPVVPELLKIPLAVLTSEVAAIVPAPPPPRLVVPALV